MQHVLKIILVNARLALVVQFVKFVCIKYSYIPPHLLITFGSSSDQYSNSTPADFGFSTTYRQIFGAQEIGGYFALVNAIPQQPNTWHTNSLDHTEGDTGGYMFLVNANSNPDQFFNFTINNLCIGSQYELSAFLANIIGAPENRVKPNILFEIRTATTEKLLIAQLSTGSISDYGSMT
jgi:hypothetical protein